MRLVSERWRGEGGEEKVARKSAGYGGSSRHCSTLYVLCICSGTIVYRFRHTAAPSRPIVGRPCCSCSSYHIVDLLI